MRRVTRAFPTSARQKRASNFATNGVQVGADSDQSGDGLELFAWDAARVIIRCVQPFPKLIVVIVYEHSE